MTWWVAMRLLSEHNLYTPWFVQRFREDVLPDENGFYVFSEVHYWLGY